MKKPVWLTKRVLMTIGAIGVVSVVAIGLLNYYKPAWGGFWAGSTTTTEIDATGSVIKTVETDQSGKTLWDWLSVLVVPLSLATLGIWFQQLQQKRTDEETKEEALQVYFDRISALLVDKNLMAIGATLNPSLEQKELLDSSVHIIRARTLSMLRTFEKDTARKSSVVRFLIEADIIGKLNLSLRDAKLDGADLSSADLKGADLRGADLGGANLSGADLSYADLSGANLHYTNFKGADLGYTNLSHAKLNGMYLCEAYLNGAELSGADLVGANLNGADLGGVDLRSTLNCTEKQLSSAKLCQTQLPRGCDLDSHRNCR